MVVRDCRLETVDVPAQAMSMLAARFTAICRASLGLEPRELFFWNVGEPGRETKIDVRRNLGFVWGKNEMLGRSRVRACGARSRERCTAAFTPRHLLVPHGLRYGFGARKGLVRGMIFGGRGDARDFILGEGEPHFISRSFATSSAVMAEGLAPKRAVT